MPIATDRPSSVDTRLLSSIGAEAIQPVQPSGITPGVQDLLAGFKNGFITVDDIQRKLADRPVEQSNRELQLQANDFKSKRLAEQEQLAPAKLALDAHRQALEEKRLEALSKDLNADEDIRPAKEAYLKSKATLEADLVSPDPKTRRDAFSRRDNFALEGAYSAAFGGEVPEYVEVPSPTKPQDFKTWSARTKPKFVAAQEEEFLQQFPQATPDTILEERMRAEKEFEASAPDQYKEYARQAPFQKSYAYQGTPDYYKELNRKLTERAQEAATTGAQFEAYKTGLTSAAKAAVEGTPATSLDKTTVTRFNKATGLNDEYRVVTDPKTGQVVSETLLSSNPPSQTENQGNAKIYSARLAFNNGILLNHEKSATFDPTSVSSTAQGLPFFPNRLKGQDFTEYQGAKRNWISAVLRRESGAAISAAEFTGADKQYFPQDGDPPSVVKQKQDLRALVEKEMRSLAGPAGTASTSAPAASANDPYAALLGKTVTDRKTGRRGVVTLNPDGTYTIK